MIQYHLKENTYVYVPEPFLAQKIAILYLTKTTHIKLSSKKIMHLSQKNSF
jgi:hypothetical protein